MTRLNFLTLFGFCWPRLFFLCGVFDARRACKRTQYWHSIRQAKTSFHQLCPTWRAKYSSSCLISTIFFCFCLNLSFAGRCGREQELCGCLLSMLLFSVNKVVVKVCLDFGRSAIFRTPCVNMFNKVKENCVAVVTRLNTADGNKTTNARRLQINAASNRKTALFQDRKQKKTKEKKTTYGTTRQCDPVLESYFPVWQCFKHFL